METDQFTGQTSHWLIFLVFQLSMKWLDIVPRLAFRLLMGYGILRVTGASMRLNHDSSLLVSVLRLLEWQ